MDNNIEVMLAQLEETVRLGKKQLIGNLRAVDADQCLALIAKIRENLPASIAEARVIVAEREELLDDARRQADSMLSEAAAGADAMIRDSEIVRQARQQADAMVSDAVNYANDVVDSAFKHVMELMSGAEYHMRQALDTLSADRRELTENMNRKK